MIWILGGYIYLYVHRPFEIWPWLGTLQIERAYMFMMFAAWAVYPEKGFASNRMHPVIAAFAGAIVFTWMISPFSQLQGTYEVVDHYMKVCVFYFLMITTVKTEKELRLLILIFVACQGIYVAHSLLEYMRGRYQYRMGVRRMIGVDSTYNDPNAMGAMLLYALPMILPFWHERPQQVPKWALLTLIGMILCAIVLTGSRGAFMSVFLLGLILFVYYSKQRFMAMLTTGGGAFAAIAILTTVLPEDLINRYMTIVDSSRGPENAQVSADARGEGLAAGIAAWQRSPMVGYGPGSFAKATNRTEQAHNLYGQTLCEMGSLGAVLLFTLVICFFLNRWEAVRLAREMNLPENDFSLQLTRALAINVVLLLIMGFGGHNLYRYNWQWYAAFMSIAVYCLRQRAAQASYQAAYQQYAHNAHAFGY
jgi:O-antigen ligase